MIATIKDRKQKLLFRGTYPQVLYSNAKKKIK